MRIISGQRRGHKIEGPKDRATRPTSDMVRESIFNILRDDVENRTVIDLFAGTGALGLEALSRGAARAIFVEQNRENVALIHRNLACMWANFQRAGASRLLVCRVLEARSLLTFAFANDIIGRVQIEVLRAQLEDALLAAQRLPHAPQE